MRQQQTEFMNQRYAEQEHEYYKGKGKTKAAATASDDDSTDDFEEIDDEDVVLLDLEDGGTDNEWEGSSKRQPVRVMKMQDETLSNAMHWR